MNISELDSNFTLPKIERTDIEWIGLTHFCLMVCIA